MKEIKFKVWNGEKLLGPFDLSQNPIYWNGLEDGERLLFTGFKDGEGDDIYEGDILYHKIQGKRKVYYPVFEEQATFGLLNTENGMISFLENTFLYRIVGNVYESEGGK